MIWALIPPRLYLYAGIGLAALAAVAGAYVKGRLDQREVCQEASLRVKIEGLQRDLTAQRLADAVEEAERLTLQKMLDESEAEIAAYETELQSRPEPGCTIDGDLYKRLRGR